jgi:glycerophosphoryl diester phosphodiesterase
MPARHVAAAAFAYLTLSASVPAAMAGEVQLGPRPFWLVQDMDPGPLKDRLAACAGPFRVSDFSIGHRGAPLQFPEHTRESYEAAARMGAGVIECDVTFTKDKELVCRHSQCDLHTTTDILATDLAGKCSKPFTPASGDAPASAQCCTSDLTLAEFMTLNGKMDAANPKATTVEAYMDGTAGWRTDLHAERGTLMTHRQAADLFKSLGVRQAPELKSPEVTMPFDGFTRQAYAQKLIDELKAAGVAPEDAFPQSFDRGDVLAWIRDEPAFGAQAVYLDGRYESDDFDIADPDSWKPSMQELADEGVRIIAPPIWMLLEVRDGKPAPSAYARAAKAAGLKIIAWTLERSGPLTAGGGWFYQSVGDVVNNSGDMLTVLDVLAREVGVIGVFSDWPATTTFYANCMGIE